MTNVIGLVLTPFIIARLGDREYGLYLLIGGLIAYLSILDLGLNNAIIRYVSLYRAEKRFEKINSLVGNIFFVYVILSAIVLVFGGIFFCFFDGLFENSLSEVERNLGKKLYLVLIFNLIIVLPGGVFLAVCNSYERYTFTRLLQLFKYIFRTIFIILFLNNNFKSLSIVIVDSCINLIFISIAFFYSRKYLKLKFVGIYKVKKSLLLEVFSYSIWIFLSVLAFQMQWNAGQTILGIQTGILQVAVFGIGIMLGGFYGTFASTINTLLLPRATSLFANKLSSEGYTREMIKFGRINFIILSFVLSGFILFGKLFILLWVGENYIESWRIALLIMCFMTLPQVQAFGNSILEAHLKNQFRAIMYLSTLSIASLSAFYFSSRYGINGVLYPFLSAMFINSLGLLLYFRRVFGLDIIIFLRSVFAKSTMVNLVLVLLSFNIVCYLAINNWLQLLLAVGIYTLVFACINYCIVLNSEERSLLKIN